MMDKLLMKKNLSHPLLQTIVKNSTEVIILLDSHLNVVIFNPVAETIFNCVASQVIGTNFNVLCPHINITALIKGLRKALVPEPIMNDQYATFNYMNLFWSVFKIQINHSDTYLLKATALNEKEKQDKIIRLETLLENMPCNVYWMDENCTMVGCNQNVLSMLNMTKEEYVGKTYEELSEIAHWPKGLAQKLKGDDQKVLRSGQPIYGIEDPPLPHADGTCLHLLTSRVPLRNSQGKVVGVAGISVDVSELKNARIKAEAANHAKTEFIANMSHDIRTPLNGVISVAEILRKMGHSQQDQEFGEMIYVASQRLLELLNSVLDVATLEHVDENDIHIETFNLHKLLRHLCGLMQASTHANGIELKLEMDKNLPHYLTSDRLKIQRILQNLLGNAIKFTQMGYISLKVESLTKSKNHAQIRFCVTDTGIGIPEHQQDQIFDRFFRASPSYEGVYQGHGVGLYIVKKFVTLLGGEITVHSGVGKGTQVCFSLKIKLGKAEDVKLASTQKITSIKRKVTKNVIAEPEIKVQPALKAPSKEKPSSNSPQILLIEDNVIASQAAQILLQNLGCDVKAAENAEMAISLFKNHHFDAVIADIGLPGIQGDEMASLLRYWEKIARKKPTPILALTAHADDKIKNNCLLAGMNQVYMKPLDKSLLENILTWTKKEKNKETDICLPQEGLGRDLPATESELFQLEKYSILDETEGIKQSGGKSQLHEALRMTIEQILPEEITNIEEAHLIHDWEKIQKIAHKLKGGSSYCGTIRMTYACQFLERYWKAGHRKALEDLYIQFMNVIEQTQQTIHHWLDSN